MLFSFIQQARNFSTSWLALSTDPWLWLCLGLPLTRVQPGNISFTAAMVLLTNSRPEWKSCYLYLFQAWVNIIWKIYPPLSDWRHVGAPISQKMCIKGTATSLADLCFKGTSLTNLVKLRFILPCKSECQPIYQNSFQIFQIKFLFLVQSFQKHIALVYF